MINMIGTAIKKAKKSQCRFKVSAIALNHKGEFLGCVFNVPRFKSEGGSLHAEAVAINKYGKSIGSIILCRTNSHGGLLPIHPCTRCQEALDKHGIKIYTINPISKKIDKL